MADSLAQHVLNLLKRLRNGCNRRIAEIILTLFNHKHAGTLGAVAGFAIAVIFSWKFLRPSTKPKRIQRKFINSESTSRSTGHTLEIASYSQVDDDEIDESSRQVKLTGEQIMRKRLNGGRKMTCQLLGVILEENSPEDLLKHATVRPLVMETLLEISKYCEVYLMERILDDESGDRILFALEEAGLFRTGGLMKDKVLFCSTQSGRSSFVRQLEPDWHVDTNQEIISQLSRFIRNQLHISTVSPFAMGSNIFVSESLNHYFSEERDV
ncbi:hypothetical protein Syun_022404 [Stephania yunnanensis]|uniref:Peroxisome biogenesis protein 22 n=1 Tax=Stephania yunnanensis TaxID=152371 RepID=A0AAP0HYI1_9MAGN